MIGDEYFIINKKKYKEERKKDNAYTEIKRYCKCGHAVYVIKQFKKVVCGYCGRYVYYDEKEEFKDKLQRKIKNDNCRNKRNNEKKENNI